MRYKTPAAIAVAVLLVAGTAISAGAVGNSFSWTGATNSNFNNAGNWTPGIPGTDDDILFPSTGTAAAVQDLGNPLNVRSLTFETAANFDLSGNPISLNENLVVTQTGAVGTLVHNAVSVLGANSTFDVGLGNFLAVLGDVDITTLLTVTGNGVTTLEDVDGPGTIKQIGDGLLILDGDGNLPGLEIDGGANFPLTHSAGIESDADVVLTHGILTGGTSLNELGTVQQLGGLTGTTGVVNPGSPSVADVGTIFFNGTVTGAPGLTYEFDYEGATSDKIVSTGVFDAKSMVFDPLVILTAPPVGTQFTIVKATDITDNSFFSDGFGNNYTEGEIFQVGGKFFSLSYKTTTIVLTYYGDSAPPQLAATGTDPSGVIILAGFLLLGGAAAAFASTRRRERTL